MTSIRELETQLADAAAAGDDAEHSRVLGEAARLGLPLTARDIAILNNAPPGR